MVGLFEVLFKRKMTTVKQVPEKVQPHKKKQVRKVPPVKGHLPVPAYLHSQLPPVPPLYTDAELAELKRRHAECLQANPEDPQFPIWEPTTEEQWDRYERRLQAFEERAERAMELDEGYKQRVLQWRVETQRMLQREAELEALSDL